MSKKSLKSVPPTETQAPIDKDLLEKLNALRALVSINAIFNNGSYPISLHDAVKGSIEFIRHLHEALLAEAQQHRDWLRATVPPEKEFAVPPASPMVQS